ncbi:MAG: hypothetical protein KDB21_17965 [Acidimicrobiales bacterium]|nr:hypothetical protein [Acidimicrobiales bacterium]
MAEPGTQAVPSPTPVRIIDELVPHPGRADDVVALLLRRYAPGAAERGLTLEHVWRSPPADLVADGIRLTIVWSVPDAAAWWRQRGLAGQDPSVVAFWADLDELLVSRDRRVCEELDR